jgi:hypothetical protein
VFWINYSAAIDPNGSDVMLYGVARAALAPLARRSGEAARVYLSASAGGAGGILRQVLERREQILEKGRFVKTTVRLGYEALVEARCAVEYVERLNNIAPAPGSSVAEIVGVAHICRDLKPADAATHWQETEKMLDDTVQRLDKIIDEAAEQV